MTDDQLPNLGTFVKAAELASFTSVARALGLTQAAVSQRIQALERVLGVSLFQRQAGRVRITEAGKRLYPHAERILALHRQAIHEVAGHRTPQTSELSLAASSIPGEHLLPDLLSAFQARHPHIQVRATVTDTRAVLRQVEQGHAHLGLVGGQTDNPDLEFQTFAIDRLVLIVPSGHAWRRRRRVTLEQLARHPLILREEGSGSRWCLERALAQAGKSLRDLHIGMELGSNESIKEAVLRGLGLAILSTHAVQEELDSGKLHALEVSGLSLERPMFAVWDRRRALTLAARLFLDLIPARDIGNGS